MFKLKNIQLIDCSSCTKLSNVFILLPLVLFSTTEASLGDMDNDSGDDMFYPFEDEFPSVVKRSASEPSGSPSRRSQSPSLSPILAKILQDYDRMAWPTYGQNEPTLVDVNMYINSMGSISAANMEFSMDIYLRQAWKDVRLSTSKYGIKETVTLNGEELMNDIWRPDLFFRNVKSASFHTVTVPNKLLKISPDGRILISMRLTLRLSCHMTFRQYPLDTQNCSVVLGPYAQPMDQVVIQWQEEKPLMTDDDLQLPEFEMISTTPVAFVRYIDTGNFSMLKVEFILARRSGYHLVQTYLPTFLIVTISWVSFWLNVDATPARVTLGVTTLLALTTVASGVRTLLPPVSYVKAIDVWIGTCSIMVFGALLEFTLVNYLSRSKARPKSISHLMMYLRPETRPLKPEESTVKIRNSEKGDEQVRVETEAGSKKSAEAVRKYNESRAKKVDQVCRVMFPFAFLIFNLAYWTYYIYVPYP